MKMWKLRRKELSNISTNLKMKIFRFSILGRPTLLKIRWKIQLKLNLSSQKFKLSLKPKRKKTRKRFSMLGLSRIYLSVSKKENALYFLELMELEKVLPSSA